MKILNYSRKTFLFPEEIANHMLSFKILVVTVTLVFVLIFLPLTAAHGQEKVENQYFSVKIPDTWTYSTFSNTGMAELLGRGPVNMIIMAPVEFANLLTEPKEGEDDRMQSGNALSNFMQDTAYNIKNAPLEAYVKHRIDQLSDSFNVTSMYNGTIGKENAVKLTKNGTGDQSNQRVVEYLVLHDKDPYILTYSADVKNFDKYLPEFEQMVRSFKFVS